MRLRIHLSRNAWTRLVVYHTNDDHGRDMARREEAAHEMFDNLMCLAVRLEAGRVTINEDGDDELTFWIQI